MSNLKPYGKADGEANGKAWYKLTNNAVYGKTLENMRNRTDVKLISNKKDYLKWTSKPSYISQQIFDNDLFAIHRSNVIIKLYKPAYVAMCH